MKPADILLMFEFNYWANHLLLDKTAQLNPKVLIQPQDSPFGNLKETLIHMLDSEYVWRILCTEQQFKGRLTDSQSFSDLESITTYWKQEEMAMRAFLMQLKDDDLYSVIRYEAEGNIRERVLWHCLWHVVNHGTQHRSQCAAMLKGFGQSPLSMDFTHFLNLRTAGYL